MDFDELKTQLKQQKALLAAEEANKAKFDNKMAIMRARLGKCDYELKNDNKQYKLHIKSSLHASRNIVYHKYCIMKILQVIDKLYKQGRRYRLTKDDYIKEAMILASRIETKKERKTRVIRTEHGTAVVWDSFDEDNPTLIDDVIEAENRKDDVFHVGFERRRYGIMRERMASHA